MKRILATAAGAACALTFAAAPAFAASEHLTEDVTGEVFPCDTHTYTLDGEISIVTHESTDKQGKFHYTGTVTTTGVTATDENGVEYRVVGAQWFGGNQTPQGGVETFTFNLKFVAPGQGAADTIHVTAHAGQNGVFEKDTSTCDS